jgi:hypothetical protein
MEQEIENKGGFSNLEHWNHFMYDFLSAQSLCCGLPFRERVGERERELEGRQRDRECGTVPF